MKNNQLPDGEYLFKAILDNPQLLAQLPATYKYDIDFLELYYIILGDKITPYIPTTMLKQLKNNNIQATQLHIKPNITLDDEYEILHQILTNPQAVEKIPTNEKYNNNFLELLYIIWGDKIEPYIPQEIFNYLKDEELMKQYHQDYHKKQEKWAKEENDKILSKKK